MTSLNSLFKAMAVVAIAIETVGCGSSPDTASSAKNITAEDGQVSVRTATPARIVSLARIEPERKVVNLASEVSGTVTFITAQAGATLKKGEVILELSGSIEKARIAQALARIRTQRAEVQAATASMNAVIIKAENAKRRTERLESLYKSNSIAAQEYDNVKAEYGAAEQDVLQRRAALQTAESRLTEYESELSLARAEYDRRVYRAPSDGTLLALDLSVGTLVQPAQSFGEFAPESHLIALSEVDELFAGNVRVGQPAFVRAQGAVDTLAVGEVSYVGASLRQKSLFADEVGKLEDRRVREVKIRLKPVTALLYGSRVESVILPATDMVKSSATK